MNGYNKPVWLTLLIFTLTTLKIYKNDNNTLYSKLLVTRAFKGNVNKLELLQVQVIGRSKQLT